MNIIDVQVAEVIAALPNRLQLEMPRLLYRLSTDGASFNSFWSKIDSADQTIIVIHAVTGEVVCFWFAYVTLKIKYATDSFPI